LTHQQSVLPGAQKYPLALPYHGLL